ncbi:glycosyl transferase family 2 [Parafrankia sp. EAN1pec]|uniref:glycosyltransferase family 2 protein n=1 Tax=Parafrankia sp. (strain EAN1pec) TaxID=298653 RepID=UPI00005436ED|nr:glycosyl transferase family 2 [Frankia sp. EAN1pec]
MRVESGAQAAAAEYQVAAETSSRPRRTPTPPRTGSVPLVTIGLPVLNGENFLERALESLVTQDYPNLQIIVADNGSTDRTEEICRAFTRRDARIEYHRSAVNRGAAWNYNRLVRLAAGTYFKWAAHDDLCAPSLVSRCVAGLEAGPRDAVLAYPKTALIGLDDAVIGDFEDEMDLREEQPHERLKHFLSTRTEYHPVFGVIRTEVLGGTSLIGRYVGSDVVLLAELALRGKFIEVPERLFLRRFHAGTSMNANPGARERASWFDPKRRVPAMPMTERTVRMAITICSCELLGHVERVRCLAALGQHWARPYARHMGGEVRAIAADRLVPRLGSLLT